MTNWDEASNEEIIEDVAEVPDEPMGIDLSPTPSETIIAVSQTAFETLVKKEYIEPADEDGCDGRMTENFGLEGTKVIKASPLPENDEIYVKESD